MLAEYYERLYLTLETKPRSMRSWLLVHNVHNYAYGESQYAVEVWARAVQERPVVSNV